ncbi:MAG: DUF2170 family protein [Alphaproteobacteria bacterium]
MSEQTFNDLTLQLDQAGFDVTPLPGDEMMLRIVVDEREEMPVWLSMTSGDEIICLAHLFDETEVRAGAKGDLAEAMLSANIAMPLSSFAKIGGRYAVYGALLAGSDLAHVIMEIRVVSDNSVDMLEALSDYLA